MELAKALIGAQTPTVEPKPAQNESANATPVHAMDLIDAMAAQEFPPVQQECAASSTKVNTGAMKKGKKAPGKTVASAPGSVKYGGKGGSGNPVKYGKK